MPQCKIPKMENSSVVILRHVLVLKNIYTEVFRDKNAWCEQLTLKWSGDGYLSIPLSLKEHLSIYMHIHIYRERE